MLYSLPETAGDLIVVQATEQLTSSDYKEIFLPLVEEKLASHAKLRLLVFLDHGFTGFEAGALWEDVKFAATHGNDFMRISIVGDGEVAEWAAKLGDLISDADCRHFSTARFLQGLYWVDGNDEI